MANRHAQEATAVSLTDTVVDRGSDIRPPIFSKFIESESPLTTTAPQSLLGPKKPHPVREKTLDPHVNVATIPPEHSNRTLVLCFDGTGDQFDADNSNIVQLVSLLKKNDRTKQMVYYQAGIGTYTSPKVVTPLVSQITKTLDTMLAWNLDAHVMDGYQFLMQNYIEGDRICIFGFSRGAYTARSLAGMLHKVGLLPADNWQQVPFAYKMYTRVDDVGWEQSNAFKQAFSTDVSIEFLGVWDTVDSVGLIPKRLPFTTSNTIVRTFRHAVALDERRAKFKANLWNRPNSDEEKLGVKANPSPTPDASSTDTVKLKGLLARDRSEKRKQSSGYRESEEELILSSFEKMYSERSECQTDIEEVWFAGCHCDVGGGSVSNKTRNSLARIPLRWMVRECFKTGTGIMFNTEGLRKLGLDPSTLYPFVTPRPPALQPISALIETIPSVPLKERILARFKKQKRHGLEKPTEHVFSVGSEEEEELKDALSPAFDQLKLQRFWWILELFPLTLRYQRGDNKWVSYLGSNLARPRFIPKQSKNGVKVHRSVQLRMEAEYDGKKHKKYSPRAQLRVEPTWVD